MNSLSSSSSSPAILSHLITTQDSEYNQTVATPDLIDFSIGTPSPSLLPVDLIREAFIQQWSGPVNPLLLQYGKGEGFDSFRNALAHFLTSQDKTTEVSPNQLMVTCGCSQAIDFICHTYLGEGDVVVMEQPSYYLAGSIFESSKCKKFPVSVDDNGMILDELVSLIEKGNIPKLVYTIPNYHNPTGVCLSEERKKKLVDLGHQFNFKIISDEPYNSLHFDSSPSSCLPSSLMKYDEGRGVVFSCGTFSKILAPALRLGWIHADSKVIDHLLNHGVVQSGGGLNPLIAFSVKGLLEKGGLASNISFLNATLSVRAKIMCDALAQNLPKGCHFRAPQGGYFIWVELPKFVSAASLLEFSKKSYSVAFRDGKLCSCKKGELKNCFRLSFAFYKSAEIEFGINRLCCAIQDFIKIEKKKKKQAED